MCVCMCEVSTLCIYHNAEQIMVFLFSDRFFKDKFIKFRNVTSG